LTTSSSPPTPRCRSSFIGAGGFAGVGRHDVAIPVNQLKHEEGKIVLPGATKEAIKALPKFEYAKK